MAKLIYFAITSLDGYIEDEDGGFGWARPSDEVHAFVYDLERPVGTYLYGRRMYETMMFWETAHTIPELPAIERDFAEVWRAADKVVYSRTLESPSSERTRIERELDPDAIRELKASADRDITVGGPDLAGQAFAAGLVDEVQIFISPVLVGGGKPALPDGEQLDLELLDERRFGNGTIFVRYRVAES